MAFQAANLAKAAADKAEVQAALAMYEKRMAAVRLAIEAEAASVNARRAELAKLLAA